MTTRSDCSLKMADYRVTWDKKKENELIDFFEAHPCLWDHNHIDYFRRDVRDALMKELSNRLGCDRSGQIYTETHIKRRWKNIRTTYARECRKSENKSDANPDNQYVSKWAFIDRLGFVKDFIKARAPNNYNNFNSSLSSSTADQSENFQTLSDDDIDREEEDEDDDDLVVCLSESFKENHSTQKSHPAVWESDDKNNQNIWISENASLLNSQSDVKNVDNGKATIGETWIVQEKNGSQHEWRLEEQRNSSLEMWKKGSRPIGQGQIGHIEISENKHESGNNTNSIGHVTYIHDLKGSPSEKASPNREYQQAEVISIAESYNNEKVSWNKEKENELISFFESNRFLWDHSHPDYFNRDLRDCMIKELSSKLGKDQNGQSYSETYIKQKWKNLRTTYARELKKMERHKIHFREAPYVSRWAHTENLSFLKDCLKIRGQSRNFSHLQNNADACQLEMNTGNGFGCSIKGFRRISNTMYGTIGSGLTMTPRGIRPGFSAMLVSQFGNVQGRLLWTAGLSTSMSTVVAYDTVNRHAVLTVQIGIPNSFVSLSYTHKFQNDDDSKLRGAIRVGVFSTILECAFEKKITEYSTLGATMLIGIPTGVTLRIKLSRGRQTFLFPIHLSDHVSPSAMFYGTAVPLMLYHAVKILVIQPYLQDQKKKEIEKKQEEHSDMLQKKKMEAEAAVHLMQETVQRIVEEETEKNGLIIVKALYGKLDDKSENGFVEDKYIDIAVPLQCLVKNSSLLIPEKNSKTGLLGFYDPCLGEEKSLYIRYKFRGKLHHVTLGDFEPLKIPMKKHLIRDNDSNGSRSKS